MTVDSSLFAGEDLESELMGLWIKYLKNPDLTVDDDFFESGGDSLLATELFFEIEQLVQKPIPPSILFETGTVRQVAERLAGELKPERAVTVGAGDKRPFHFFHGDFNNGGISVRQLAKMIGPDRPTIAIAPHGLDNKQVPETIEEMAADRIPEILEAQPEGPYLIGGHCNGALVAFEAARQLVNAGHEVDLVVLIDPINPTLWSFARPALQTLRSAQRLGGVNEDRRLSMETAWLKLAIFESEIRTGRLADRWRRRSRKRWKNLRHKLGVEPKKNATSRNKRKGKSVGALRVELNRRDPRRAERMKEYAHVISDYRPSPLNAPILYIALGYSSRGWRNVSSQMEMIDRSAHHVPTAEDWNLVRARLDALDPGA